MSHLRSFVVAGILLSCAIPSTSHAMAIAAGGSFFNNDRGNGVNLQLYPQFYIAYGITPELQIGANYVQKGVGGGASDHLIYVPAMVGLRFDFGKVLPLGPIAPFLAAHVGYAGMFEFISGGQIASIQQDSNNLGYNVYAGTAFWLADTIGLGIEGGVDIINAQYVDASNNVHSNQIVGCARAILQFR